MATAKQIRQKVSDARGMLEQIGLYLDDVNDAADDADDDGLVSASVYLTNVVGNLTNAEDDAKDAADVLAEEGESDDDEEEES